MVPWKSGLMKRSSFPLQSNDELGDVLPIGEDRGAVGVLERVRSASGRAKVRAGVPEDPDVAVGPFREQVEVAVAVVVGETGPPPIPIRS
ncbi:MAG: hypothetical protein R2882_11885 [Gemmatimonadales bacterium]